MNIDRQDGTKSVRESSFRRQHIMKVMMLTVAPVSSTRLTVRERLKQPRIGLSVMLTLLILTTLPGETWVKQILALVSAVAV